MKMIMKKGAEWAAPVMALLAAVVVIALVSFTHRALAQDVRRIEVFIDRHVEAHVPPGLESITRVYQVDGLSRWAATVSERISQEQWQDVRAHVLAIMEQQNSTMMAWAKAEAEARKLALKRNVQAPAVVVIHAQGSCTVPQTADVAQALEYCR